MLIFNSALPPFNESDVQRTTSSTPTNNADNSIDYSFYVNVPSQSSPMAQLILASVIKFELGEIEIESDLRLSIVTSYGPLPPSVSPNAIQLQNTVVIRILNQQADQVCGNRL